MCCKTMKLKEFTQKLTDELRAYFLDYRKMKKQILEIRSDEDERLFKNEMDLEILRIFTFINNKHMSLLAQTEEAREGADLKDQIFLFAEFVRMNMIVLKRLLRHHDEKTGFDLMDEYKRKIREKKMEIKNLTRMIVSSNGKNRNTSAGATYWIPPECLVNVKLSILKYLPRSRYVDSMTRLEDSCVSVIYLDTADLSLYRACAENKPDAIQVGLRWVGPIAADVYCEMTTFRDGRPETTRIRIAARRVLDFLNGIDVWNNKTGERGSYERLRETIRTRRLRPVLRVFFRRCVFEDPSNSKIKINLDSNIVMIKEASDSELEADRRPLGCWARTDVSHEWPFRNLSSSEIVRFPCSVAEVVVDGGRADWLEEVLAQSKIERVNGFCKYLHGSAVLYPTLATEMPYWLPQKACGQDGNVICRSALSDDALHIPGESEMSYETNLPSEERTCIAIPVRVEPKVFFANERTFLSWVQFAIFLGGVGSAMVGLGGAQAYLCGVLLIGVAAVFAFYALYLFHDRALRIRVKDPGPYEDTVGPMVLIGIFVFVMLLSFIFKFPIKKTGLKTNEFS